MILHLVGTLTLHAVGHMAVDIQRKRGGGVTQVALHCLNVDAGADGRYRVAVPQVMIPGVRTANGGHRLLVVAVYGRFLHHLSWKKA